MTPTPPPPPRPPQAQRQRLKAEREQKAKLRAKAKEALRAASGEPPGAERDFDGEHEAAELGEERQASEQQAEQQAGAVVGTEPELPPVQPFAAMPPSRQRGGRAARQPSVPHAFSTHRCMVFNLPFDARAATLRRELIALLCADPVLAQGLADAEPDFHAARRREGQGVASAGSSDASARNGVRHDPPAVWVDADRFGRCRGLAIIEARSRTEAMRVEVVLRGKEAGGRAVQVRRAEVAAAGLPEFRPKWLRQTPLGDLSECFPGAGDDDGKAW